MRRVPVEDAELALMAAVEDSRLEGLFGHHAAIALMQVLADQGWELVALDADDRADSH